MGSMAFLPEEFSGSDEWSWMLELPSDDIGPLIEFEGKVSVALDPVGISWIHDGLTGWPDGNWFSKV
jgi:hypothetical protein